MQLNYKKISLLLSKKLLSIDNILNIEYMIQD